MEYATLLNMDRQGRIVIPIQVRKALKLEEGDLLALEANEKNILLRKQTAYIPVSYTHLYLELQMLTISSLKKSNISSEEGDTPEADPESWYTLIGKVKLENLIGQLHAKGHKKLYINESGQIYIQNGDTQEIKDRFDYFPPRNYWDVLITLFQKEDLTCLLYTSALFRSV